MTLFDRREFLSWARAAASQSFANAKQPRKRYLFLDSRVVERAGNAVLRVGKVRKDPRNPLFGEEKPWEARFDNLYANVVREPDTSLYRCWYSPFIVDEAGRTIARAVRNRKPYRAMKREMGVCYAESDDGLKWTKPALGLERGHPALGTSGPRQRPDPAGATGSSVSRVCVRTASPHWNHARRTMPQW